MNVDDAAHAVVHGYPGGAASLAPRMGMSVAVLNSKVNPNTRTHHLTLREAVTATQLSNDKRILQAAAAECDSILLDLPNADDEAASDMAMLEMVTKVWTSQGDVGQAIHQALTDGRVTRKEFLGICAAINRSQATMAALQRRMESIVEQGD
jgi:predicted LPLAT superfamily acyltransferase